MISDRTDFDRSSSGGGCGCMSSGAASCPFTFMKVDGATGAPLPAAVFRLSESCCTAMTAVSSRSGRVRFFIEPCTCYILTEQRPPAGYEPNNASYMIYMDECGCLLVNGRFSPNFTLRNNRLGGPTPPTTRTVTGLVAPFVYDDLGYGTAFLQRFSIDVELRTAFGTPATGIFKTTATAVNNTGLGRFTFHNVPFGSYVLYIKRPGYLARPMPVTVSASDPDLIELMPPEADVFELAAGDVNDDYIVDNSDLAIIDGLINTAWGDVGYTAAADLNADGVINALDNTLASDNYGMRSSDY